MKNIAIVLAAGEGRRMGGTLPKQFLVLDGEPLICKSLRVFEKSPEIDGILIVTSADWMEYCRKEIAEGYGFSKVTGIIEGGAERYDSVYAGLCACRDCGYVFIHDAARPYVTEEIVKRTYDCVISHRACVAGMPSKDTVKIADDEGAIESTPPRSRVWIVQTPQVFEYALIRQAYDIMMRKGMNGITDDAMTVERAGLGKVMLVEGSYANIKITTAEDLGKGERNGGKI